MTSQGQRLESISAINTWEIMAVKRGIHLNNANWQEDQVYCFTFALLRMTCPLVEYESLQASYLVGRTVDEALWAMTVGTIDLKNARLSLFDKNHGLIVFSYISNTSLLLQRLSDPFSLVGQFTPRSSA
jgi:hypothetical protein